LAKLHYVGNGRYLNGVPASDFETWDLETIAICLESGLYTEGEPPKRRGRPPLNKLPEPDFITKFVPLSEGTFVAEDQMALLHKGEVIVPVADVNLPPSEEKES
jgi:hypothetical protein